MRMSSLLSAAVFAASLAAGPGVMAADFSGIPQLPQQLTQLPADPPAVQQHFQNGQTGLYDSPDFVLPPYEIYP